MTDVWPYPPDEREAIPTEDEKHEWMRKEEKERKLALSRESNVRNPFLPKRWKKGKF